MPRATQVRCRRRHARLPAGQGRRCKSMAKPRVFVFAPADPTGEAHRMLEAAGCELILGKAGWETPQGDNEAEMAAMAAGCDALMGTSIRSSPITAAIMAAAPD